MKDINCTFHAWGGLKSGQESGVYIIVSSDEGESMIEGGFIIPEPAERYPIESVLTEDFISANIKEESRGALLASSDAAPAALRNEMQDYQISGARFQLLSDVQALLNALLFTPIGAPLEKIGNPKYHLKLLLGRLNKVLIQRNGARGKGKSIKGHTPESLIKAVISFCNTEVATAYRKAANTSPAIVSRAYTSKAYRALKFADLTPAQIAKFPDSKLQAVLKTIDEDAERRKQIAELIQESKQGLFNAIRGFDFLVLLGLFSLFRLASNTYTMQSHNGAAIKPDPINTGILATSKDGEKYIEFSPNLIMNIIHPEPLKTKQAASRLKRAIRGAISKIAATPILIQDGEKVDYLRTGTLFSFSFHESELFTLESPYNWIIYSFNPHILATYMDVKDAKGKSAPRETFDKFYLEPLQKIAVADVDFRVKNAAIEAVGVILAYWRYHLNNYRINEPKLGTIEITAQSLERLPPPLEIPMRKLGATFRDNQWNAIQAPILQLIETGLNEQNLTMEIRKAEGLNDIAVITQKVQNVIEPPAITSDLNAEGAPPID